MTQIPWLPKPEDYAHPTNAGELPHPSLAVPAVAEPAPADTPAEVPAVEETPAETVATAVAEPTSEPAPAPAPDETVGPYPPAAPTVVGDQVTESVNQAGPAA